jgi:hypothetical protein
MAEDAYSEHRLEHWATPRAAHNVRRSILPHPESTMLPRRPAHLRITFSQAASRYECDEREILPSGVARHPRW